MSRGTSKPAVSRAAPATAAARHKPRSEAKGNDNQASSTGSRKEDEARAPVNLVGLDEQELRRLLGPPAAEENRPPGKLWRYHKGKCTLNVSLYPDVQTRKFGTLTYEVKSDDNTDEGKRVCLAELQSGS
jgi:hypothetical protein